MASRRPAEPNSSKQRRVLINDKRSFSRSRADCCLNPLLSVTSGSITTIIITAGILQVDAAAVAGSRRIVFVRTQLDRKALRIFTNGESCHKCRIIDVTGSHEPGAYALRNRREISFDCIRSYTTVCV